MARHGTVTSAVCSFCAKPGWEARRMVAGRRVCICDECVALCKILLEDDGSGPVAFCEQGLPTPRRIRKTLDQYVIGQDRAKKILSVAVHNHYKRISAEPSLIEEADLPKSNVLLLGPSGVGKTLLARTLARALDLPFAIADATTVTESGYVGTDVEDVLARLLIDASFDLERAERGIVYIDELDKLAKRELQTGGKDVGGEGVQQSLLAMLEGSRVAVTPLGGRKHPQQRLTHVDTTDILFVCGGSFAGLDDIIERRLSSRRIGFGQDAARARGRSRWELLRHVQPEDLVAYGLIPELVGRIPVMAPLHDLSEVALFDVLTMPRDALVKQYRRLLAMDGVELEFTDAALTRVAQLAHSSSSGARNLRAVLEVAMLDIMYDAPSNPDVRKVVVDERVIDHHWRAIPS